MSQVILSLMLTILLVGFFSAIYRTRVLDRRISFLEDERRELRAEIDVLNNRIIYIREDEVGTAIEQRDKAVKELARYKKATESAPAIKRAKKAKAPPVDLFLDI